MTHKNKILNAFIKDEDVYIKNTGIKVELDYFGTDIFDYSGKIKKSEYGKYCKISIKDLTNDIDFEKLLKLFFTIDLNCRSKGASVNGVIRIDKLNLIPFETDVARALYEKK